MFNSRETPAKELALTDRILSTRRPNLSPTPNLSSPALRLRHTFKCGTSPLAARLRSPKIQYCQGGRAVEDADGNAKRVVLNILKYDRKESTESRNASEVVGALQVGESSSYRGKNKHGGDCRESGRRKDSSSAPRAQRRGHGKRTRECDPQ